VVPGWTAGDEASLAIISGEDEESFNLFLAQPLEIVGSPLRPWPWPEAAISMTWKP
jgi:hypothetical protein